MNSSRYIHSYPRDRISPYCTYLPTVYLAVVVPFSYIVYLHSTLTGTGHHQASAHAGSRAESLVLGVQKWGLAVASRLARTGRVDILSKVVDAASTWSDESCDSTWGVQRPLSGGDFPPSAATSLHVRERETAGICDSPVHRRIGGSGCRYLHCSTETISDGHLGPKYITEG